MQLYELSDSELTVDRVRSMLPESDAGIKRAIPLVQEMVVTVRARSDRAETRAAVILGATGILSGFVAGFSDYLRDPEIDGWWVLGGLFLATLVLLIKAVIYGFRAINALKGFELSPEAGIEMSGMTERDAEREELADRVWEYYQLLSISNSRLYYSQRSQKNLGLAVVTWVLTAISSFILSLNGIELPECWEIGSAGAVTLAAFFADVVIERTSKLWKWIP